MRYLKACCFVLLLIAGGAASAQALVSGARDMVETQRRILALHEASGGDEQARTVAGQFLFHGLQDKSAALSQALADATRRNDTAALNAFFDYVERGDLFDLDRLTLRETLEDWAAALNPAQIPPRLSRLQAEFPRIQARYARELTSAMAEEPARGIAAKRGNWDAYVDSVRDKYSADAILKTLQEDLPNDTRGASKTPQKEAEARANELSGRNLPPKTLLLTFDDGPHPRYTDQLLAILARYKIKALFFQIGKNLGTAKDGKVTLIAQNAAVEKRILAAGHAIANHSYSHAFLPKLDDKRLTEEIDSTQQLIAAAVPEGAGRTAMFRAPYGARNPLVLTELADRKLRSVMWNIDSLDWEDPVSDSVAKRVIAQVEKEGRGIILFHDIHARSVEALPQVLDNLIAKGYKFASWNGTELVVDNAAVPAPASEPLYRESYAVIIGIDDYNAWPKLRYATHDAGSIKDVLVQKYGFKEPNVTLLTNKQATRENIMAALGNTLADARRVKREDRVFVFFAGHGATRRLPSGRDLGYIIPVDAAADNFTQAISMTQLQDIAEAIPAKHLLFVMDSCYSGLALTRGGGRADGNVYARELAKRGARQMFTAGGADEQVADNGPNGHSIFTWTLLQGLEGKADLNGDGIITASELAAHVSPIVSTLSRQTPAFGNLVGSEGGDMIFETGHASEYLNGESTQLDDEAARLADQIAKFKGDIAAKAERNAKLRAELASLQAGNAPAAPPVPPAPPLPAAGSMSASAHNDRGTALFREKQYAEAQAEFEAAVKADPNFALAVNNLGYAHYRLEHYPLAAQWFEKTIVLDPKRAVAYLNLGDVYVKLDKKAEAKRAYEKYLELAPTGRGADSARQQLRGL
ncbi:MAG: polysaccharide deacetylase [Betaproteobacteria bacterium]|nr:polysaccharide deacetylase [Betaproteobacteria bacterium]